MIQDAIFYIPANAIPLGIAFFMGMASARGFKWAFAKAKENALKLWARVKK